MQEEEHIAVTSHRHKELRYIENWLYMYTVWKREGRDAADVELEQPLWRFNKCARGRKCESAILLPSRPFDSMANSRPTPWKFFTLCAEVCTKVLEALVFLPIAEMFIYKVRLGVLGVTNPWSLGSPWRQLKHVDTGELTIILAQMTTRDQKLYDNLQYITMSGVLHD